jgi:uncharacterized protein YqgC (DUF456 family)
MDIGIVLLWMLAVICIAAGLAGLILPVIPGPVLLLTGFFLAAWAENFVYVGAFTITILTILAILAYGIDFIAGALGAKHFGASRQAAIGAAVGALIGIFFGFIGIITGPFIGAVVGELTVNKNIQAAGLAGIGTWIGMLIGTAAKAAIGFSMVGIFIFSRLF